MAVCGILIGQSCSTGNGTVLFVDGFGPESRGELRSNVIQLPSPQGLGYAWMVLEQGFDPLNWEMVDELGPDDPKKGFWVIHPDSMFLQQAGRSHNSVLFARTPVPEGIVDYDISFRQYRHDNDYIGYIIGAEEPAIYAGFEFGYMTQVPGTDSTVNDAHISGALGELKVNGMALMQSWADHLIEVRQDSVTWYINGVLLASMSDINIPLSGYFGIRQRYDRNTRYDDVMIRTYRKVR